MNYNFENLNKFFEQIKSMGFFQRIFAWISVKSLSYDAYEEFKNLQNQLTAITQNLSEAHHQIELLKSEGKQLEPLSQKINDLEKAIKEKNDSITNLKETISSNSTSINNFEQQVKEKIDELEKLKGKYELLNNQFNQISKENTSYKQSEENRRQDYEKKAATLSTIQEKLQKDEEQRHTEKEKEIQNRLDHQKQTWSQHEENIETIVREICRKHTIEYLDKEKVPFKGKPDNTIKICDEFVIFDAKSPATDDWENFSSYIKLQTESVKKYVKEENVKKDIFLVIPSNTVDVIKQFTYNLGDYKAFIVTPDALEPIILCLKKIEEYEFAEQLSPEERDNICRIIGKFAHLTKRRIQIDYFFSQEFLSILSKCKMDLPEDVLKNVIEFEKAEKLNPPQEKRAKQILTSDLEKEGKKIKKESEAKDIAFPDELSSIKQIPLSSDNT